MVLILHLHDSADTSAAISWGFRLGLGMELIEPITAALIPTTGFSSLFSLPQLIMFQHFSEKRLFNTRITLNDFFFAH